MIKNPKIKCHTINLLTTTILVCLTSYTHSQNLDNIPNKASTKTSKLVNSITKKEPEQPKPKESNASTTNFQFRIKRSSFDKIFTEPCLEVYDQCQVCKYVYTPEEQVCTKCNMLYKPLSKDIEQAIMENWYFAESNFIDFGLFENKRHKLELYCEPDFNLMMLVAFIILLLFISLIFHRLRKFKSFM